MSWTFALKPIEGTNNNRDREYSFLENSVSVPILLACVPQYDS